MINTQVDVEGHTQKYTIVEVPTSFWNTGLYSSYLGAFENR